MILGLARVSGGLLFGLLLAAVRLSRSTVRWSRAVAVLLSLAFLLATIFVAHGPAPASSLSLLIGAASMISVGAAGVLLVVAVAMPSSSSLIASLATWSTVMIAGSLLLGTLGVFGFAVLNIPVWEMGVVEGIGPGNYDKYAILLTLRNQGPIVLSLVAAALGATVWRATGRTGGAAATLVGCVGVGVNVVSLFLQSGD